jgi:ubiquinone/menaquinone biosynthesis C-methylase UbiE
MRSDESDQEQRLFQSVREYYSTPQAVEIYTRYAREFDFSGPERAMVAKFMSAPATVLDIGCGAGSEAFALTRMGYAVTGLDIVAALLEQGRALALQLGLSVSFVQGDGKNLDFPESSFDYVLLITQMIHHVPLRTNRVHLLREALRVVKSSGKVLLTYHDWDILKTHEPWGCGDYKESTQVEWAQSLTVLEPGDGFGSNCQGVPTGVYGYGHNSTQAEMESEVLEAGLEVVDRADFRTIAGGEPDEFWRPTRVLVMQKGS